MGLTSEDWQRQDRRKPHKTLLKRSFVGTLPGTSTARNPAEVELVGPAKFQILMTFLCSIVNLLKQMETQNRLLGTE